MKYLDNETLAIIRCDLDRREELIRNTVYDVLSQDFKDLLHKPGLVPEFNHMLESPGQAGQE